MCPFASKLFDLDDRAVGYRRGTNGILPEGNVAGDNLQWFLPLSTLTGVHQRSKYVTQIQQQRPESPTVTLTWHACKYKVHQLRQRYILRSLSYLCYVFRALLTPLCIDSARALRASFCFRFVTVTSFMSRPLTLSFRSQFSVRHVAVQPGSRPRYMNLTTFHWLLSHKVCALQFLSLKFLYYYNVSFVYRSLHYYRV